MSDSASGDAGVNAASAVVAGVVAVLLAATLLLASVVGIAESRRHADVQVGAAIVSAMNDTEAALRRFDSEPVDHAGLAAALDCQRFGYPDGTTDVPPGNQPLLERGAKLLIGLGESRTLSIRAVADAGLAPAAAVAQGQARADAIREIFITAGVPQSSVVASSGAADPRHVEFTLLPSP
ncbi:hypothetical protein BH09PSE6_BH09PSE6_22570 [soil metagenome]